MVQDKTIPAYRVGTGKSPSYRFDMEKVMQAIEVRS
jgi:hypothetical protein